MLSLCMEGEQAGHSVSIAEVWIGLTSLHPEVSYLNSYNLSQEVIFTTRQFFPLITGAAEAKLFFLIEFTNVYSKQTQTQDVRLGILLETSPNFRYRGCI